MVTVTINLIDYDVYADADTADDFLAADFARAAAWTALTADQKSQALVTSTRRLDRLKWLGTISDPGVQPLEFPRDGLVDCDGNDLADGTTPQDLIDASIILAADISVKPALGSDTRTDSNIKRVRADKVEVEFFRAQGGAILSKQLMELLSCFLAGASLVGFAETFGTDADSVFFIDEGNPNYYERSGGFS